MDFATVFTATNSAEAELVRSRLEAAGFEVYIENENSAISSITQTLLQVPEAQAADARALIEAGESPSP